MTNVLFPRAAVVAALALASDQLLKFLVRQQLPLCQLRPVTDCSRIDLLGPFRLVRIENAGTSLSFFRDSSVALGLAVLSVLLITLYASRLRRVSWVGAIGMGLQAGGAAGNLLDRFLFGAVTDFINVAPRKTFNMADVWLVIGMLLAVWTLSQAVRRPTTVAAA